MSIEFFTRLPLHGETFHLPGDPRNRGDWNNPSRPGTGAVSNFAVGDDFTYIDYLSQIARGAEIAGFDGVLMVNTQFGEEPWIVSSLLARETKRLKFVAAFHPSSTSPWNAAQAAATYQRATGGRLVWNIIQGSSEAAQRAIGDELPHDERYERAGEFVHAVRGYFGSESFTYQGKYYSASGGGLRGPLRKAPIPRICTAGASDAAKEFAAQHADYYLLLAEDPAIVAEHIRDVRERALKYGRTDIQFGLSVDVIARATDAEARAEAKRIFDEGVAAGVVDVVASITEQLSPTFQKRRKLYHDKEVHDFDDLFIAPNLWAGYGYIGIPPGFALVGDYAAIVERIREFQALGISLFFIAGYPHLEEAYRIGEHILPHFRSERVGARVPANDAAAAGDGFERPLAFASGLDPKQRHSGANG